MQRSAELIWAALLATIVQAVSLATSGFVVSLATFVLVERKKDSSAT